MIRIPTKIPITIYPAYWVVTAVLSFILSGGNILGALLWMVIIFISVVFHEFGHAWTAKIFGRKPRIELVAMGGLTYHDGDKLAFWKQFLITLNGPFFGLVLALVAIWVQSFFKSPVIHILLEQISSVNILWTVINLIPVLPLDGGQLLRLGFEKWLGAKGLRYTFLTSGLFALLGGMACFIMRNLLGGAIFFLFAFENLDNFRKSYNLRESDRNEELKQALMQAEQMFRQGHKEEALAAFEQLRTLAGEGMLYDTATQYVALILDEQGKVDAAYDLLKSLKERLSDPALLVLHRLAFDRQDDQTVSAIGASVFQVYPLAEVALRNAYTAARLKKPQDAIGWLETAQQNGIENLAEIVQESAFDPIRKNSEFKQFIEQLSS